MTFAVLNPGGRDPNQIFADGAGSPATPGHPPVNYHGYAACMRGGFFREVREVPSGVRTVLVLLRKRNLRLAAENIRTLRGRGCAVYVSLKESGAHQVAETLGDVARWELFSAICSAADGAISSTPGLCALYRAAGAGEAHFIPTPYPVGDPAWNFSTPLEKRRGIFVGTREFGVPSRNHMAAVVIADQLSREFEAPLAVMNIEGRRGGMILKSLRRRNPLLFIIEAPLAYPDFLRLMTLHRIVWQLDSSHVPGQIAGDALLCRMPCIGGNGAIDCSAFGAGDATPDAALRHARSLLSDEREWTTVVEQALARARELISFEAVAQRLRSLAPA